MFDKYAQYYDALNAEKPYKKEIDFVYAWAGRPKRILDIGCGTAEYWKHFPSEAQVSGLEKSREMINRSKYHHRIANYDVTKAIASAWERVDLVTALFDVINYIPRHDWWKRLPLKKGGSFIFDIFDDKKVWEEGFKKTTKEINGVFREITPIRFTGKYVDLKISVTNGEESFSEEHRLYIYSEEDIEKFCGKDFELVSTRTTDTWQKYYKLIKR